MLLNMRTYTRTPDTKRFWRHVNVTCDCWEWTGQKRGGYGRFETWNPPEGIPRFRAAHRFAYEQAKGRIPPGMTVDHLCKNKACVKPYHMEIVTPVENAMRGNCVGAINKLKTHCPKGHEYTPENIRRVPSNPGARYCRACHNAETHRSRKRGGGG